MLAAAQKYVEKKKYDKAVIEYERIIQEDPNDARTLLKIGDLQARLSAYPEAIATYDRVGQFYASQGFALKAIAVYRDGCKRTQPLSMNMAQATSDGKAIAATVDGVPFPPHHEGHSGFVIGGPGDPLSAFLGIAPLVVNALTTYPPNIVTLMIGTNDMNDGDDVANAPMRLAALIDSIASGRSPL